MILVLLEKISQEELKIVCDAHFSSWVKFVVDIKREVMTVGGDLHADGETQLIESGSVQSDLWGGNFYPWKEPGERLEYTAFINIRPRDDNPGMEVMEQEIKEKIKSLAEKYLLADHEQMSLPETG
jgi:hypothetical protein